MKFYRDWTPVPRGAAYDSSIPRVVPTTWEEWLDLVVPGDVEMTDQEMEKIGKELGVDRGSEAVDQAVDEIFRGLHKRMGDLSFLKADESDGDEEKKNKDDNSPISVYSENGSASDGPALGASALKTSQVVQEVSKSAVVTDGAVIATGIVSGLELEAQDVVIEVIEGPESPEKEKQEDGLGKNATEGTEEKEQENGPGKDAVEEAGETMQENGVGKDVSEGRDEVEESENVVGALSRSDNNEEEDETMDVLTVDAAALDIDNENQIEVSSVSSGSDEVEVEAGDVWDYAEEDRVRVSSSESESEGGGDVVG